MDHETRGRVPPQFRYFDSLLDPSYLGDEDVERLQYFGLSGALFAEVGAVGEVQTAGDLIRTWDALCGKASRFTAMLDASHAPCVSLRVPLRNPPRRAHASVWRELERRALGSLAAIGPLELPLHDRGEIRSLMRQIELAHGARVPLIVDIRDPRRGALSLDAVATLWHTLRPRAVDAPPLIVVVAAEGLDTITPVDGACILAAVSSGVSELRRATEAIHRALARNVRVSIASTAPSSVLDPALVLKLGLGLVDLGVDLATLRAVLRSSVAAWFVGDAAVDPPERGHDTAI